ncbi:MAG TPA: VOC family protein [Bryobacteraceae bacterium]|nr:VOC family protein [Bryobacteraceae bacterium]
MSRYDPIEAPMPVLNDLKETALYVTDLERATTFYRDVLGLPILVVDSRFCAFDVAGKHILLLFTRGASLEATELPGGTIPPHDGAGQIHAAFAIDAEELPAWESHLLAHRIDILSCVSWPRGGKSVYFRDPDGHLLELLTPGVWSTY